MARGRENVIKKTEKMNAATRFDFKDMSAAPLFGIPLRI